THSKKQLQQLRRSAPFSNPYIFLEPHSQRIDSFTDDLATTIKHFLQEKRLKCMHLEKQLHLLKPAAQLATQRSRLRTCEKALHTALVQQLKERQTALSRL